MNTMLEMTDIARDKIQEVLDVNSGKYLRITIEAGWGGPRLGLALDELKENEETTRVNGIDVLISDRVKPYSDGNKIDYIQSTNGEGFVINNPGQTDCEGCSCWYSQVTPFDDHLTPFVDQLGHRFPNLSDI